jgi:CRISPR system Cascade subunit CasE
MSGLILSRITLAGAAPLVPQLLARVDGPRTSALHRFVWSCFPAERGAARDFLWREDEDSRRGRVVYTLARRAPVFAGVDIDDKPFAPALRPDQRLAFRLRANATVTRKLEGRRPNRPEKRRITRDDIVMARMRREGLGPVEYGPARTEAARLAAIDWLAAAGKAAGFEIAEGVLDAFDEEIAAPAVTVEGYRRMRITRGPETKAIELGVLDLSGELVISEPERYLAAIEAGFGRARGFGCGLMMIRRAR